MKETTDDLKTVPLNIQAEKTYLMSSLSFETKTSGADITTLLPMRTISG
jgi:hypothetical protein